PAPAGAPIAALDGERRQVAELAGNGVEQRDPGRDGLHDPLEPAGAGTRGSRTRVPQRPGGAVDRVRGGGKECDVISVQRLALTPRTRYPVGVRAMTQSDPVEILDRAGPMPLSLAEPAPLVVSQGLQLPAGRCLRDGGAGRDRAQADEQERS